MSAFRKIGPAIGALSAAISPAGGIGELRPVEYFFGTFTAPRDGYANLFAWGGGASGSASGAGAFLGGGGGGAFARKRVRLRKGQQVQASIGRGGAAVSSGANSNAFGIAGQDTTVTLPDGSQMIAGRGRASTNTASSALRSVATGGDENAYGGAPGYGQNVLGEAGQGAFAGLGGNPNAVTTANRGGAGGGAGGPANRLPFIPRAGDGASGGNATTAPALAGFPGGGGMSAYHASISVTSSPGADGYFLAEFVSQ